MTSTPGPAPGAGRRRVFRRYRDPTERSTRPRRAVVEHPLADHHRRRCAGLAGGVRGDGGRDRDAHRGPGAVRARAVRLVVHRVPRHQPVLDGRGGADLRPARSPPAVRRRCRAVRRRAGDRGIGSADGAVRVRPAGPGPRRGRDHRLRLRAGGSRLPGPAATADLLVPVRGVGAASRHRPAGRRNAGGERVLAAGVRRAPAAGRRPGAAAVAPAARPPGGRRLRRDGSAADGGGVRAGGRRRDGAARRAAGRARPGGDRGRVGVLGLAGVVAAARELFPPGTGRLHRGLPSVVALRGVQAGAFFGVEAFLP